jgi:plasmid stabilization system protein ParE
MHCRTCKIFWDFVASDNVPAADKLENEFFEAFEMLAERPRLGHARSDLTERDVRFWPVGSHLIVRRSFPTALQIVAVALERPDVTE